MWTQARSLDNSPVTSDYKPTFHVCCVEKSLNLYTENLRLQQIYGKSVAGFEIPSPIEFL